MKNLARGVRRRATQMSSVILLNFYKNNRGFATPVILFLGYAVLFVESA